MLPEFLEKADFLSKLLQKDHDAFVLLYETVWPKLVGFIKIQLYPYRNFCDRNETAQDIAGEVFEIVYTKIHLYDNTKGGLVTWIFNIAKNRAVDYCRKTLREKEFLDKTGNISTLSSVMTENNRQLLDKVEEIVQQFSFLDQEYFTMMFKLGYDDKIIANKMDVSEGAVRTRRSRLLAKLRRLLS